MSMFWPQSESGFASNLLRSTKRWCVNFWRNLRAEYSRRFGALRPQDPPRELPWPEGATARLLYVSKVDPKWGMVGHRFADGKFYPINRTEPWEPSQHPEMQWELSSVTQRPRVEKSQPEQVANQSEAKS